MMWARRKNRGKPTDCLCRIVSQVKDREYDLFYASKTMCYHRWPEWKLHTCLATNDYTASRQQYGNLNLWDFESLTLFACVWWDSCSRAHEGIYAYERIIQLQGRNMGLWITHIICLCDETLVPMLMKVFDHLQMSLLACQVHACPSVLQTQNICFWIFRHRIGTF